MKILLLGKNGQLGWELQRSLVPLGEIIALDRYSTAHCGDLSNTLGVVDAIEKIRPDVIVNAAAYTAVDKAESDQSAAKQINATVMSAIAESAEKIGAILVHFSTDYVFNGMGNTPWVESDPVAPLNVYGKTKCQGEEFITQKCSRYLIFRTSWVYAAKGKNFAKSILALANQREELSIINDQIGAPTGAELLADCTAHAILKAASNEKLYGIYHLVASGTTTWYEYAKFILEKGKEKGLEFKVNKIIPVSTESFPTAATRPKNSQLNNSKFQQAFEMTLPDWRSGLVRMLDEVQ